MTADSLKYILTQSEITDEDKHRLTIYLGKKNKNKRKRNLLREIREKFNL